MTRALLAQRMCFASDVAPLGLSGFTSMVRVFGITMRSMSSIGVVFNRTSKAGLQCGRRRRDHLLAHRDQQNWTSRFLILLWRVVAVDDSFVN